jgi:hypothetical protein
MIWADAVSASIFPMQDNTILELTKEFTFLDPNGSHLW